MNNKIKLSKNWTISNVNSSRESIKIHAEVPTNTYVELVKNDLIQDPYYSENALDLGWVETAQWLFEAEFDLEVSDKKQILCFESLDTFATIYLNGSKIGETENMFRSYHFDISDRLKAKDNKLQFIATNIPRRFASNVFRGGFESLEALSDEEKSWIAPLPIKYNANLPGYVKMKEMMGGHGGDNLPKAQAVKDATMGYFILKNRAANKIFMHYNGSYHSDNYEGINWYLKQGDPTLKIVTVSVVEQDDIKKFNAEEKLKADFIIVVPTTMTKTY